MTTEQFIAEIEAQGGSKMTARKYAAGHPVKAERGIFDLRDVETVVNLNQWLRESDWSDTAYERRPRHGGNMPRRSDDGHFAGSGVISDNYGDESHA